MFMRQRNALLLTLTFALLLTGPALARAETVLFACSEYCPLTLFEALELELRGHGAFLVARLSPSGFSVAAHEADAQRMAALVPAAAVLWIEREPPLRVRVLGREDDSIREAPLATAPEEIDPRVFAAIAGSVVLQTLGAPGHTDGSPRAGEAPASVVKAPAQSEATPMQPISQAERAGWPAAQREAKTPPRFFLRAGAALGFAFLKPGMRADRAPPRELVTGALAAAFAGGGDLAQFHEFLERGGYDCDVREQGSGAVVASSCNVALKTSGVELAPGIDLAAGANVTARLALAATLRIAPDAGFGTMNHVLFGAQAEYTLTAPRPTGFWANAGGGFAFGRIQVQPHQPADTQVYVTSGPYEAHAMIGLGYRFLRYFGLYATPTLRLLFPDRLWMLEPNLGVEGRL